MRKLFVFLLLFISSDILSQISIDYPYKNQIFQRDNFNVADVSILGAVSKEATKVEYQLLQIINGVEQIGAWKLLDSNAIGGFYQAKLKISGGLYKLKVRSLKQSTLLDSTTLNRFGVGEVLILAGQSNAHGVERTAYESGTTNEMVFSANFSNVYEPTTKDSFTFLGTNNYNYPIDKFEILKTSSIIGPTGQSNYYWPKLGEQIASQQKVPVCFFNVAWGGTSIRNWAESSRGIASKNPWIDAYYPVGFPFNNLKQVVKSFAGINGARAVLWQIGETDTQFQLSSTDFISYFKEVKSALTNATGLSIPFIIAQSTFMSTFSNGTCSPKYDNSNMLTGLTNLWDPAGGEFLTGPNTDLIEIPRLATDVESCVHFSPNAFSAVASAWYDKIFSSVNANASKVYGLNFPLFEKFCGENNTNKVKLSNQNFDIYQSANLLQPNTDLTYSNLTDKTFQLMYKLNPKIQFSTPNISMKAYPQTTAPIITSKSSVNFCQGSQVTLESNVEGTIWNNSSNSKTITVSADGTFYGWVKNALGCQSLNSNSISVKVFDNPKAPVVTQTSPYVLYGGIKVFDTNYHWQFNSMDLNKSEVFLKVNQSGTYKLYATKTYLPDLTCKSAATEFSYTLPNDGGLTAYPNPVGTFGQITIESISNLSNAKFTLVDELGKLIKEGIIASNDAFTLDVNGIATGKYILLISTADKVNYTKRVIIGK